MGVKKTIITCAVTGASLSPSMSAGLPVTPDEIVTQSLAAVEAGAAIVHLHAREPADGRPTNDVGVWREIVSGIRAGGDAVINMSASMGKTPEDRLSAVLELRPEIATVIVGSMNYGLFRKAENQGISEFKLDWEKQAFGPASYEIVTDNSFAKIDRMIATLIDNDIGIVRFERDGEQLAYAISFLSQRVPHKYDDIPFAQRLTAATWAFFQERYPASDIADGASSD